MIIYTSFKNFWYILFSNIKIITGGIIPIAIFISIFACFSLLYTNTFAAIDFLFSIKKYSLIFNIGTTSKEIDRVFAIIKNNPNTKEIKKVSPANLRKEISDSFKNINQELASLKLEQFPYVIEFILGDKKNSNKLLTDNLKKNKNIHLVISGVSASDQIQNLTKVIENLGLIFTILFAVSLFYILSHTIQISFFNFIKEIEIYLILGSGQFFIQFPFLLLGLFISLKSFLLGILLTYFFYIFSLSLVTFNENTFFLKNTASFFSMDFLLISLLAFLAIGLVSAFSALHYAIKKVTF